jgi:hypothetical protein
MQDRAISTFGFPLAFERTRLSAASREEGTTLDRLVFGRVQFDPEIFSERSRVLGWQRICREVPESEEEGSGRSCQEKNDARR